jgi:hypothetical protein
MDYDLRQKLTADGADGYVDAHDRPWPDPDQLTEPKNPDLLRSSVFTQAGPI